MAGDPSSVPGRNATSLWAEKKCGWRNTDLSMDSSREADSFSSRSDILIGATEGDVSLPTTPTAFLREYERCANTHRFDEVAPLIAEDAIFWCPDGSYQWKEAIRQAFEATVERI